MSSAPNPHLDIDRDPHPSDDALRAALCASVQAPETDTAALLAMQDRILAQWATRQAVQATHTAPGFIKTGGSSGSGTLAGLLGARQHKPRQWQFSVGFAALALLLVVAFQATQTGREANMDDLLEPDVLALIAMGEL